MASPVCSDLPASTVTPEVIGTGDRRAVLFRHPHGQLAHRWTVRAELHPYHRYPHSVWHGGIVLSALATATRDEAVALARSWVDDGVLPDGTHPTDWA